MDSKSHPPTTSGIHLQYRSICKTHRKLVRSGTIRCSVDLDSSPTTVADSSSPKTTQLPSVEGSVHWGSVIDISGVQTPRQSFGEDIFKTPDHNRRISSTDPQFLGNTPVLDPLSSSLESVIEVFEPQSNLRWPFSPEFEPELDFNIMNVSDLEQEAQNLNKLKKRLYREMREFSADDITAQTVDSVEPEIERIKDKKNEYQDLIEDFIAKWSRTSLVNAAFITPWNDEIDTIGVDVKNYVTALRAKKSTIIPASSNRMLEIQEASLILQQQTLKEQQSINSRRELEKKQEDENMAESEGSLVLAECSVFTDMLTVVSDWEEVDDEKIADAMRSLDKWQQQMNILERTYRKFESMAVTHRFPATKSEAIFAEYDTVKRRFEEIRKSVKQEDTVRSLFTLEPPRADVMKYPTYSGLASEDYIKFKDTMEQRFRDNKVKRREQVTKLRECLKGAALGRVPDGITDISEAFRRLNEAFGNPSKVMGFHIKALEDLGMLPPEKTGNGQFNYSKQIEWYLKLEVILNKILELSKRNSKLAHEAYSSATYRKLWMRFPTNYIQKLVKVPGEDAERLEGIIEKIVTFREQAQLLDDECGNCVTSTEKKTGNKATADVFFRQSKVFNQCRICTHLSATGSHHDLFINHLSNYATGCPKFIEAAPELRRTLARKVKFCSQCFNPDLIWTPAHMKECPSNVKKNKFSCSADNCREHMWICLTHKLRNKSLMDKFKQDLQSKGFSLALTTHIPLQITSCEATNAVRKIKRGQQKKGREIVPVPTGDPLFLFHATQGKSKPVNTFYDTGCSHAVFRDGIPGEQLRGQLIAKGPFSINGVGGLNTAALDEWVTCVKRVDNKIQLVQGLTVSKVTADFPLINLFSAVHEVKSNDPTNEVLQSCKLPPMAGGTVDMLLGSKYLSVFPKPIHSLPCGLTIYRSQLASHDGQFDSCIGGPHSSFSALASLAGGTSQLIAAFVDGLSTYKQWGPPVIKSIPLSQEENYAAKQFNLEEMSFEESGLIKDELAHMDCDQFKEERGFLDSEEFDQGILEHTCCGDCTLLGAAVASDERVKEFKRAQGINESGLDVEYRCPKCRQCAECKSSDKTEKVSLREESEMYEIRKSVRLDLINKKIQCSLPLRGKERDFLSDNRDRALRILQQQCKKYFHDTKTKEEILAAFAKLFNNGHAKLLSDLSLEQQQMFLNKDVQHHIPWRVVFSSSATTPCRPVMDASTRTAFRSDGSAGRCLNDLVCKGKIETLNLVKVLLRFSVGKFGVTGDLQQFYNACKLDPDMWNLQRFLWLENLDPKGEVLEAVMTTLIYGVKCVSAQSEFALEELAKQIEEEFPELASFLVNSRYVDDLQDSRSTQDKCFTLAKNADTVFERIGLKCKAWTYSGLPPPAAVSKDGLSIGVGGFAWYSEGDILELKIPQLHFGKPKRGKFPETVKFFNESDMTMNEFVPQKLTKRQVTSKLASVYDILGKLAPITIGLKVDLSDVFKCTKDWDDAIPLDMREKWVHNFITIEKCRGLRFTRAVMPPNAVNTNMRLLTGVDAAQKGLIMGCWGGFLLEDNTWSNKLVIGRSLLASNESIPKDELQALCAGSNLAWVVRVALSEWVDSSVLFGDSKIALCWLTSEKLRLSLFHRNRVLQIRRGTELNTVYHCKSENNPADCGTRPGKVQLSDIGPESRWENGDYWMTGDISCAVDSGILTPVDDIRISNDDEDDFNKGLVFGDRDEVLTRGHTSSHVGKTRVNKIEALAKFSNYLILPTKFKFPELVRVYGYVFLFISKARKGKEFTGHMLQKSSLWFSAFKCDISDKRLPCIAVDKSTEWQSSQLLCLFGKQDFVFQSTEFPVNVLTERSLHLALLYLFRKGSAEVKEFCSQTVINKFTYEKDGLLLSKGRLLEGINFVETGEFGDYNIGSLGIKINTPVLARYSPLSYSIGQHIHWTIGRHRGIETSNRISLQHVTIMQGMTLYRELSDDCIRCQMKRKKLVEVPMGPVANEQLIVAPPFFVTMLDLFGPMRSFVPGFERATRARRELESKVHIMVSVCATTRVVNLQALEGKSAAAIIDGFTRLGSEVGIPTKVLIDQDSGAMAAFNSAELDLLDTKHQLHTQYGISFETCPKGGHDQHGLVEAVIKSIQETFDECGLKTKRIHALGWQTFCKLAENTFNNLPLGFSYGRQQDNTELLKIISPNMLRIGRVNSRALQGPIRLPVDKKELMSIVENTYKMWFNIFKETVVPRLIHQPKWFRKNVDLKEEDVVYFQKEQNNISSEWKVGVIDQLVRGRDGFIRRVLIRYTNASETDPVTGRSLPRITDRSIRGIVKLWSMDEVSLMEDLSEVRKRLDGHVTDMVTVQEDSSYQWANIGVFQCGQLMDLSFTLPCQVNDVERRLYSGLDEDCQEENSVNLGNLSSILNSIGFTLE